MSASPLHLSQRGEVPCGTSGKESTHSLPFFLIPPFPHAMPRGRGQVGPVVDRGQAAANPSVDARAVAPGNLGVAGGGWLGRGWVGGQGSPWLSMGNFSEPQEAEHQMEGPARALMESSHTCSPGSPAQAHSGGDVCSTSPAEWRPTAPDTVMVSRWLLLWMSPPSFLSLLPGKTTLRAKSQANPPFYL